MTSLPELTAIRYVTPLHEGGSLPAVVETAEDGFRAIHLVRQAEQVYDLIFLDCPPGVGLIAESIFEASDALLVPLRTRNPRSGRDRA